MNIAITDQMSRYEEYSFIIDDKRKYADVALLNDTTINFIFEIFYTHKTNEKRQTSINGVKLTLQYF